MQKHNIIHRLSFGKRFRAQACLLPEDKEIAVKIRGNSHCRNLKVRAFIKSECLSGYAGEKAPIKVSWANGEAEIKMRPGICIFCAFVKGAFILSFL